MTEVKGTMVQADPHKRAEDEGAHDPQPIVGEQQAVSSATGGLVPEGAE
jgi:hypothetical protein